MPSNFTEDKLIACIQNKQKYKGVQPYIQQACKFNQEIYTVINGALVRTLIGKKSNCMTRLLALRFFKQLILTGNFTMIDSLDETIQDYILEIAQYNSKSKQSRGANYFVDLYQIKKEEEIVKLGISYVVLATEIVGVTSKIYPVDQNGDETRFVKYYKKLIKLGLSLDFNKCNYFKKEEVQTFHKNYKKWLEWCQSNYQEEEPVKQENLKDKTNEQQGSKPTEVLCVVKDQNTKEMINLKNVSVLNSKPSEKSAEPANTLNLKQPQSLNQSVVGPFPNLSFSSTNQMNLLTHSLKAKQNWEQQKRLLQNEVNTQKKQIDDMQKEKIQMQQKYEEQIKLLTKLNQQFSAQNENLKTKLSVLDQSLLNLQVQLKQKQNQLRKPLKPINQSSEQSQKSKRDKNLTQTECYKILISAPKNIDLLEEENDVLKQALQKCQKQNYHSQQQLKNQNQKLRYLLEQKQQLIASLKQQQHYKQQKELVKHITHDNSLAINEQIKNQKINSPLINFGTLQTDNYRSYLKTNVDSQGHHNRKGTSEKKKHSQQRPKSLKKTQSHRRLNNIAPPNHTNLTNTAVQFYNCNQNSHAATKLLKTSHNFTHHSQQNIPKLITTFPYLEDYFPKLPEQFRNLKQHCLLVSDLSIKTFYENQLITAAIKILSLQKYVIVISNQTNTQKKIKLMAAHQSIVLEGQKTKKIAGGSTGQFQISASSVNFNLRFPILTVVVGTSGLNLTNSVPSNHIYQIYLPITLLNYCQFQRIQQPVRHSQTKKLKYTTSNFLLNNNYRNIKECFPFLEFSIESRDIVYRSNVEFRYLSDAKLILQIRQSNRDVIITTEFQQLSINSCSLAKVLLQLIAYLIKKE